MKLLTLITIFCISASASAFPYMSTKEKVRLELWAYGLSDTLKQSPPVKKSVTRPLPVELEQALLKF